MRLLLLIMTGIGFTLGLLCGLLLHLPTDGLPANVQSHVDTNNNNNNNPNSRGKRSVGDQSVELTDGLGQKEHSLFEGNLSGSRGEWRPSLESSFQSRTNLGIDFNSFVSGSRENNNGNAQTTGQGASQTKLIVSTVKAGRDKGEAEGLKESPRPPIPAINPPVTSFTLRLKNTGGRFVVDSAVQRREDGAEREGPAQSPKQRLNTDVKASSRALNKTLGDIVHGVLWSGTLEDMCPQGAQQLHDVNLWRRKAAGMEVVRMEEGCGRMQNRLVTFKDGSQACARYRLNTDQIQGEVYSYYLAHLLHIPNLPPALLLPVDTLSPQWRSVHLEMSQAQWADGHLVVLTRWLDDLLPSHIPHELREDDRKVHPTLDILGKKNLLELCDLLQWSDLIVFDYLTANLDRMVNNMFNRQWNAEMMKNAAHNLERAKSGSLVFLDNESGLFHGYRLLEKYHGYHEALLTSLCVFRESTAQAVKTLHESKSVGEDLQKVLEEGEVHHRHLPVIPEKNLRILQDRLTRVYDQIVRCEALYGR